MDEELNHRRCPCCGTVSDDYDKDFAHCSSTCPVETFIPSRAKDYWDSVDATETAESVCGDPECSVCTNPARGVCADGFSEMVQMLNSGQDIS